MEKRVGILTHYYNSNNYGGNLQAFALTYVLNKMGFKAEQIAVKLAFTKFEDDDSRQTTNRTFLAKIKNKVQYIFIKILLKLYLNKKLFLRSSKINTFNKSIPHSDVYSSDNIEKSVGKYDCFISGSDQVWNLDWFFQPFFLTFVPSSATKIAYAASLGHNTLSKNRQLFLKDSISTFDYISVREDTAIDILQPLVSKKIELVLDPTYLLDEKEWLSLCKGKMISKKYVLCYFLGHDRRIRKISKKYALNNRLAIVNLPHLSGVNISDLLFGDFKLYDVDPRDFITLVKYSECVITDSFHACVFSTIFKKNFIAFNRKGKENMSSRIKTLTKMFDCADHFIEDDIDFSLETIEKIKPVNYSEESIVFSNLKKKSLNFLKKALKS